MKFRESERQTGPRSRTLTKAPSALPAPIAVNLHTKVISIPAGYGAILPFALSEAIFELWHNRRLGRCPITVTGSYFNGTHGTIKVRPKYGWTIHYLGTGEVVPSLIDPLTHDYADTEIRYLASQHREEEPVEKSAARPRVDDYDPEVINQSHHVLNFEQDSNVVRVDDLDGGWDVLGLKARKVTRAWEIDR